MTYSVGLTFSQGFIQFKKLDSFRRRFDGEYFRWKQLYMALLPPFKLENGTAEELGGLVEDLLDDHLLGEDGELQMKFTALDYLKSRRRGTLYLRPEVPPCVFHIQEALAQLLLDYGVQFKREKQVKSHDLKDLRTFLPVARFQSDEARLLETAISSAREEFNLPLGLYGKNIMLFEKAWGGWGPKRKLFTFASDAYNLLEEDQISMLGKHI